jgi:hypothetical protein
MITRKLRTFRRFTSRERRLALDAMAWMAAVRLGLWLMPFRKMQRLCARLGSPRHKEKNAGAVEIALAVRLAGRYVPRATCLVQAFAAQILLGRHGHPAEVHIGVALDGGFQAHAWVKSGGAVLIGGAEEAGKYAPIL